MPPAASPRLRRRHSPWLPHRRPKSMEEFPTTLWLTHERPGCFRPSRSLARRSSLTGCDVRGWPKRQRHLACDGASTDTQASSDRYLGNQHQQNAISRDCQKATVSLASCEFGRSRPQRGGRSIRWIGWHVGGVDGRLLGRRHPSCRGRDRRSAWPIRRV